MTIRQADLQDANDLSQLLKQLGYPAALDDTQKRIQLSLQEGYRLMVGELDNRCIAFISMHWYYAFHHSKPIGRVVAFCVDDIYRDKGYGSQLLKYAEAFFHEKNCLKVELTSNLRRKESHEYYLHRGYQKTSMHFVKYLDQ